MKKLAVFVLVISVFSGAVFGQGQEFTFRGLPWGSSVEDIIAKEGPPNSNGNRLLIYQNKGVAGYDAMLSFYFSQSENGLTTGQYSIWVTNDNCQFVYNDLLNKLSILYGTPIREPRSANDRYNYWVFSRTRISLSLMIDLQMRDLVGTLIEITYASPQSSLNSFGDL